MDIFSYSWLETVIWVALSFIQDMDICGSHSSILSCLGEKGIQPNQSFPAVRVDEVLLILGYICVLVQKLGRSHISYYNRL